VTDPRPVTSGPVRRVVPCMGTVFSFDVRSPGVSTVVLDATVDWLHWVDETFSTYRADSQISQLGNGEITVQDCAPEVRQVLARCAELEAETGGYFCAYADGALDPSGLVKGWAIEAASDQLLAGGSINHCVNGGGDVQCVGLSGPATPWRIGIAHPRRPASLAGVATGGARAQPLAVATSGTAERGEHITDPHSGTHPHALLSVTLVGTHLSTVDAYATAAFAMGAEAKGWIDGLPDIAGLIVYADNSVWSSAALSP
jgi:thiamine biosynthesis lipoprotein